MDAALKKDKLTNLSLDSEVRQQLKELANSHSLAMSAYIRMLIRATYANKQKLEHDHA